MSTATVIPVSEYLNTSYRPDCDYVDGEIIERNVGEWDHARLQTLLSRWLGNREKEFAITVVVEQRVQIQATRFRVPDIIVLRGSGLRGRILTEAPFICVEILSPRDRVAQMQTRINDYLKFGVQYVWLIDPETSQTFIYTANSIHEAKDGILTTTNPDIRLNLAELE